MSKFHCRDEKKKWNSIFIKTALGPPSAQLQTTKKIHSYFYLLLREIPPTNSLRLSLFVGGTLQRVSWFLFAGSAERDVKSVATVVVATAKSFSIVISSNCVDILVDEVRIRFG